MTGTSTATATDCDRGSDCDYNSRSDSYSYSDQSDCVRDSGDGVSVVLVEWRIFCSVTKSLWPQNKVLVGQHGVRVCGHKALLVD